MEEQQSVNSVSEDELQENTTTVEEPASEATPDEAPAETTVETATPATKVYASKEEVIARMKEIASSDDTPERAELDHLKAAFYKLHLADAENKQKQYLEAGGAPENYRPEPDDSEEIFRAELDLIKEKRAKIFADQATERQENLKRKEDIIEKIKAMATSPDEANKSYKDFKALQDEWKTIGAVPPEKANETWRNYHLYNEQYYDLLNLNREAREYDFKKNLEAKTHLCEAAEKLAEVDDVVSAFHQLQELHNQYREIGPVDKEQREAIWARFKAASTAVNKRHQEHFEKLRVAEEDNLQKKTALCEQVEAIVGEENKSAKDWDQHTKQIIDLQAEWKKIGFAPQKMNVKIFERFRASCDKFFTAKSEYFRTLRSEFAANADKKRTLIAKAKELAESTDWKSTADKLINLQKEWKTIGSVPHKLGDQLWSEFNGTCNKFFEARNKATGDTRQSERDNLKQKRDIIDQLKSLLDEAAGDVEDRVQELLDKYNAVGHVPFKDKDKLYKDFHDVTDKIYDQLHISRGKRRLENFRSNLSSMAKRGEDAIDNERARLMRQYEQMKQQVQTYENNLGFLSVASKKGNALVDEMNRKVQKLRDEMNLLYEKIKAIDKMQDE